MASENAPIPIVVVTSNRGNRLQESEEEETNKNNIISY
jgi:hypothetical protein